MSNVEIYKAEVHGNMIKLPQKIIDRYGKRIVCMRPWIGGVLYFFNRERWDSIVETMETRMREEQNKEIRKGYSDFMKYWGSWGYDIEVQDTGEISIDKLLLSEWVRLEGVVSAVIVDGFQTQYKFFALMSDESYLTKSESICSPNFNLFKFEAVK